MSKTAYITYKFDPIVELSKKTTLINTNSGNGVMVQLMMSTGGGFESCVWYEYVYLEGDPSFDEKFIRVKDVVTGEIRVINTSNIVEVKQVCCFVLEYICIKGYDNYKIQYYFSEPDTNFKVVGTVDKYMLDSENVYLENPNFVITKHVKQ